MTTWFGQSWGAPVCDVDTHADTPVGAACGWCTELITADDSGVILPVAAAVPYDLAYHRNCFLRTVIGSCSHQDGDCSCHDGRNGDPPGMTPREAADAAVEMFYGRHDA